MPSTTGILDRQAQRRELPHARGPGHRDRGGRPRPLCGSPRGRNHPLPRAVAVWPSPAHYRRDRGHQYRCHARHATLSTGIDLPGVYDSTSIQHADPFPQRPAIIGGGPIGLEFASMFSNSWIAGHRDRPRRDDHAERGRRRTRRRPRRAEQRGNHATDERVRGR